MVSSDILLLQETKIEDEALLLFSKTKWNLNANKGVSARGTSGGLVALQCGEKFQLNCWFDTQHWISLIYIIYSSKISLVLFNIYVPVTFNEKKECWKTFPVFIETNSPSNIIIAADLNISLAPNEKKIGIFGKDHFQETMEDLIQFCELSDIKPKKG